MIKIFQVILLFAFFFIGSVANAENRCKGVETPTVVVFQTELDKKFPILERNWKLAYSLILCGSDKPVKLNQFNYMWFVDVKKNSGYARDFTTKVCDFRVDHKIQPHKLSKDSAEYGNQPGETWTYYLKGKHVFTLPPKKVVMVQLRCNYPNLERDGGYKVENAVWAGKFDRDILPLKVKGGLADIDMPDDIVAHDNHESGDYVAYEAPKKTKFKKRTRTVGLGDWFNNLFND